MKKSLLIGGALLLACLIVFFLFSSSPPEPVWQGRTLTSWTDDLAVGSSVQVREDAEKAVQAIGTNAIPHLIKMVRARETVSARIRFWLNGHQRVHHFTVADVGIQHTRAVAAFQALAERAEPALPELQRLLLLGPDPQWACDAMARISPKCVPLLLDAIPQVPPEHQCTLLIATLRWPSQAAIIRPAAERFLNDPSPWIPVCAAAVIKRLPATPP